MRQSAPPLAHVTLHLVLIGGGDTVQNDQIHAQRAISTRCAPYCAVLYCGMDDGMPVSCYVVLCANSCTE